MRPLPSPRVIAWAAALGLVLVFASGTSADARRPAVCEKKGGKRLLSSREARVFRKHLQIYACLRGRRRAVRLGGRAGDYGDDDIRDLRLRGRFVAYSLHRSSGRRIRVKELRRGRTVHDALAGPLGTGPLTRLTDVELKRNGSVVWILRTDPIDVPLKLYPQPEDFLPFFQVAKSDRLGQALLDSGRDIAAGTLTVRGSVAYWVKGRRWRSAPLD